MYLSCRCFLAALSITVATGCAVDDEELTGPELTGDDNLGGVIVDDDGPIAGATVSIYGAIPAITTTTNAAGQFALQAIDVDPYILVEAPGHWGNLDRLLWDQEVLNDLEFFLPADALVGEIAASLSRTVLESNGIVIANFYSSATLEGATGSIDVASDVPFTFDASGDAVESDTLIPGAEDTELVYTNVPPGDVEFIPVSTNDALGCSGVFDTNAARDGRFPVLAKVISRIQVYCGPL